jgi:hypothetical protein
VYKKGEISMFGNLIETLLETVIASLAARELATLLVVMAIVIIAKGLAAADFASSRKVRRANWSLVLFGAVILISSVIGRDAVKNLWGIAPLDAGAVPAVGGAAGPSPGPQPCREIFIVVQSAASTLPKPTRPPADELCNGPNGD